MKTSPKKYAKLLLELVHDKNEAEVKNFIDKFVKLLAHKNELKNSQKIIKIFTELWNKKQNIIEVEITTARKINSDTTKHIEKFIKERTKAREIKLENKINKDLISGAIIKYGDRILDNSLKTKINDLKINMIK